jgi:hypothetical protein
LYVFSQESGIYNWPLKPGMSGWKELKTHDEMLEVLQIPTEILDKLTTKDLAQTCLNYPLFPDIWAFNNLQGGMEQVIAGFNGLQEFLKRADAGSELYEIYRVMNPDSFDESWDDLQKGKFVAKFAMIEILLAQEAILSSLEQDGRFLLLRESVNKQRAMQDYPMYDRTNQEPNAYLMGKIMQKDNSDLINQVAHQKSKLEVFLQRGSMASRDIIGDIVSLAQGIVNN